MTWSKSVKRAVIGTAANTLDTLCKLASFKLGGKATAYRLDVYGSTSMRGVRSRIAREESIMILVLAFRCSTTAGSDDSGKYSRAVRARIIEKP